MGHYDECYEAEYRLRRQQWNERSKAQLEKQTPGALRQAVKDLIESMEDTQQHERTFSRVKTVRKLFNV